MNQFPIKALPYAMQDALISISALTGSPIEAIAGMMLSEASWAIQGHFDVQSIFIPNKFGPTSIYTLTIIESGGKKSSICDLLAIGRVRYEAEAAKRFTGRMLEYNGQLAIWAKIRSDLTKKPSDQYEAAEMLLEHDRKEPKRPPNPESNFRSFTTAGFLKLMQFCRPSLGVFTPEAAEIFCGYSAGGQNGGELDWAAKWTLLWDEGSVEKLTALEGLIKIRSRRMSAGLMCQPVAAQGFISSAAMAGQGIQARMLISRIGHISNPVNDRSPEGRRKKDIHLAKIEAFSHTIYEWHCRAALLVNDDEYLLAPEKMCWEDETDANILNLWYNERGRDIEKGSDVGANSFYQRVAEHASRIAAVLAAFEGAVKISNLHAGAAVEIIEYYIAERQSLDVGDPPSKFHDYRQVMNYLEGWFAAQKKDRNRIEFTRSEVLNGARHSIFAHKMATAKQTIFDALVYEEVLSTTVLVGKGGRKGATTYKYLL